MVADGSGRPTLDEVGKGSWTVGDWDWGRKSGPKGGRTGRAESLDALLPAVTTSVPRYLYCTTIFNYMY